MTESINLKACGKLVRGTATDLVTQIVAYFHSEQVAINEIIVVPLLIIARIFRTYDAIQILLNNSYASEAAVLTLTQFELRLDLAYTATDIAHATKWLDHEDISWSVAQNMEKKINGLFTDLDDRTRLSDIFKYLSGIKHGNPTYSALGFPARENRYELQVSTGEIDDRFSEEFLQKIASYSTYQLAWASQVLHKCTAQYAIVNIELRQTIQDFYLELKPEEERFCIFLEKLVKKNKSPFGLKRWKGNKKV
jgi:hypothetical protein